MRVRWRDTLFRRLFVLMCLALVGSHLVALAWMSRTPEPPAGLPPPAAGPSTWRGPSLPPRLDAGERLFIGPWVDPWPLGAAAAAPPPSRWEAWGPRVLDVLLRGLVIAVAAWWGARWLCGPMHRLAAASQGLADSIGRHERVPALDEGPGTEEVQETARRFNAMARRLDAQFKERGLFVAAISHDLRAPLARVRMRLETWEHEPLLRRCIADVQEMNDMIDAVLEVFRAEGVAEPVRRTDVTALARALRDDLVEQGHRATLRGPVAMAPLQPAALRRALSNLMGNAVRHGGRADVSVRLTDTEIVVHIDDAGPGIPESQLQAVFEPFYRANRERAGAGLGLYIARELVQRQGGRLTLQNRSEGGLRASVALPRETPRLLG
ncbi:sensor histidine kinase [Piscinibacter gummiphilus]|uniref:sensor histidine kinase n=1 Tax=Piscinibacter gummiphilus TaxID=946333 RepID=UPI000A26A9F0|nr:ATP-binding protein [Piscinibacter gummiphilus]ATU64558.1 two-component sensor histidine kinase [Piscinibacter gummiphilus]GLS95029.1 hypothetical protein GCM10007918_23210 [Piscinibacter gummiphilus]